MSEEKALTFMALLLAVTVLAASCFIFPLQKAHAVSAPVNIVPDTNTTTSGYQFDLLGNSPSTHVFVASNFYADGIDISGTYVNFTNAALASAANPAQTFGVGVESGNVTISSIGTGTVTLTPACTDASTCYVYYYYAGGNPVYAIETAQGPTTTKTDIQSTAFSTDSVAFSSASAPAVYQNTASQYIKVKVTYSSPTTITFFVAPTSTSTGGGGGSIPTTTVTNNNPQPQTSTSTGGTTSGMPATLHVDITAPEFNVAPGDSQTLPISIKWQGATKIIIDRIDFTGSSNMSDIHLGKSLPLPLVPTQSGEYSAEIPLTVSPSPKADGESSTRTVVMHVVVSSGVTTIDQTMPIQIHLDSGGISYQTLALIISVVAAAIIATKIRTSGSGRGRRRMSRRIRR